MATHSSILAWEIPWTEEPGGLWSMGSQTDTTEVTSHTRNRGIIIPNWSIDVTPRVTLSPSISLSFF